MSKQLEAVVDVEHDARNSRVATVLVTEGRVEVMLVSEDPEWVREALATLAQNRRSGFDFVIAGPGGLEDH